ncbi:MAG: hypothetical protein PQJ44_06245, partial [Sphaerochaetaceae bacterium]|nr:hypothetical protein [Sphaerochaetaceae bacterium]
LPAFREHVIKYSTNTNENIANNQDPMAGINEAMGKMDEFSAIASKIASGEMNQDEMMKLLSNNNISLVGGAVLGALGAGMVAQMIKDKEKSKKEEEI